MNLTAQPDVMQASKKALRKVTGDVLRSLTEADIQEQSHAITKRVLSSDFFTRSKSVGCYVNMAGEVNTDALTAAILDSGRALFVPRVEKGPENIMRMLKIINKGDFDAMPRGMWGIRQPESTYEGSLRPDVLDADTHIEPLDVILIPGVAFDRSMSRLGHGKGYYDRFISRYINDRDRPRPLLVALSLRQQLIQAGEVPTADHDWKMDLIVTPDCILGVER